MGLTQQEKQQRQNDFFTDLIIGISDGLTVPFALAAGLSGAGADKHTIINVSFATISLGTVLMTAAGYRAGKVEVDHYEEEISSRKDKSGKGVQSKKAKDLFAAIGLSEDMQTRAAEEVAEDNKQWLSSMTEGGIHPPRPDAKRPVRAAATIGLSYATGGFLTILPYFFTGTIPTALSVSVLFTLIALFVFGILKSTITGVNKWMGALRLMLTGGLAAAAAFCIARLAFA